MAAARFTMSEVKKIRDDYGVMIREGIKKGEAQARLGAEYGVSPRTIHRAIYQTTKTYRDVVPTPEGLINRGPSTS